eukprot:gb/GECG01000966.1/.p1 GENE.gb/GECG01000966.1/~~gb/GECG01000966.1/.p1  ORF type:complete len:230 (+),score=22.34 gb/GECG01000966.1/:1-690(+)
MALSTYALAIVIAAAVVVVVLLLYCEYDRRRFWKQSEAIARSQFGGNPVKHQEFTPDGGKGTSGTPSLMDRITGRSKPASSQQTPRGPARQGSKRGFVQETVPVDTENRSGDQPEIFMTNTAFYKSKQQRPKNSALTTRMPSASPHTADTFYNTGRKSLVNKNAYRGHPTTRYQSSSGGAAEESQHEQKLSGRRQNPRGASGRHLQPQRQASARSGDRRSPLDRMESFR